MPQSSAHGCLHPRVSGVCTRRSFPAFVPCCRETALLPLRLSHPPAHSLLLRQPHLLSRHCLRCRKRPRVRLPVALLTTTKQAAQSRHIRRRRRLDLRHFLRLLLQVSRCRLPNVLVKEQRNHEGEHFPLQDSRRGLMLPAAEKRLASSVMALVYGRMCVCLGKEGEPLYGPSEIFTVVLSHYLCYIGHKHAEQCHRRALGTRAHAAMVVVVVGDGACSSIGRRSGSIDSSPSSSSVRWW